MVEFDPLNDFDMTLSFPEMRRLWAVMMLTVLPLLNGWSDTGSPIKKPNFLWILSEDNSRHYLELFDVNGAATPNIRAMAEHGIRYEHAFSCSPVCSVARTTLMTSVYAPRIGTHFHRKIKPVTQPEGWQLFPAFLREYGYHTTNNSKKDYNVIEKGNAWDASSGKAHWSQRENASQPFFHMQSFGTSHESSLHFPREVMENTATESDPESVYIPPIFPRTDIFKYTTARYHDRIRMIDDQVGKMIRDLEEAGELENTFIFYFGDHGGVLPGSKGYIYERGVHVPLVVRIPDNFRHLVDCVNDAVSPGFVSFIDFGPTLLHLAGVRIPEYMDGRPILGDKDVMNEVHARNSTFSYADRFDEKYDMVRAVRVGPWKYIRNFQGYYPDGLQNNYRYKMLAYEEWRQQFNEGILNPVQASFFNPRPAEMLFNVEEDPYETQDLAGNPAHRKTLRDMRRHLNSHMRNMPDLSFFPENVLVNEAVDKPLEFAKANRKKINHYQRICNLALQPYSRVAEELEAALKSEDPIARYWGLSVCSQFGSAAKTQIRNVMDLTTDTDPLTRLKAAEFLALVDKENPVPVIHYILQTNEDPVVSLIVLNSVVFLRDHLGFDGWEISRQSVKATNPEVMRRIEYLQNDQTN